MGMLDDAIREHLDLKRRQGADAAQIAQLEAEALGGAKDEPPEEEPEGAVLVVDDSEHPAAAPIDSQATEQFIADEVVEALLVEPEPAAEVVEATPEAEPEPVVEAEAVVEAEPIVESEAVVEAEVEAEPAAEPVEEAAAPAALDELEATPDFLEETPEHDRLWFERKPPRDFDF